MKRSRPMRRGTELKRSGFKRQALAPTRGNVELMPSTLKASASRMWDSSATMSVPVPKTAYVRDERLQAMCRAMACKHCGVSGPDAGVTWAHSNWADWGNKGKAIKASDNYVAALCAVCHAWLDQGMASNEDKRAMWLAAHLATVARGLDMGLWPSDIPLPITSAPAAPQATTGNQA